MLLVFLVKRFALVLVESSRLYMPLVSLDDTAFEFALVLTDGLGGRRG